MKNSRSEKRRKKEPKIQTLNVLMENRFLPEVIQSPLSRRAKDAKKYPLMKTTAMVTCGPHDDRPFTDGPPASGGSSAAVAATTLQNGI